MEPEGGSTALDGGSKDPEGLSKALEGFSKALNGFSKGLEKFSKVLERFKLGSNQPWPGSFEPGQARTGSSEVVMGRGEPAAHTICCTVVLFGEIQRIMSYTQEAERNNVERTGKRPGEQRPPRLELDGTRRVH